MYDFFKSVCLISMARELLVFIGFLRIICFEVTTVLKFMNNKSLIYYS